MTLTGIIYGLLFQPSSTFQYLSREKPLKQGLLIFLSIALFNVLISQGIENISIKDSLTNLSPGFVWAAGGIGVIASMVMLFFMAGFLSLISEIIYGHANGKGLLVCLSFAFLPSVLGAPLQYAALLTEMKAAATALPLLAMIWVMILQVIALREALSLRNSQAILLFLLPLLILLALCIVTVLLVVTVFSLPFMQF
ncbi:MAG: Yip1 family protein [Syntrophomonadaceae bacterium]|nr:Yip1 family protein [Syntrophomonadaceae bacterium]